MVGSSPRLIAASYVLRRLLAPRHPPCALSNLATTKDARARYVVLKVPGPVPAPAWPDLPAGSGTGASLRLRVRPCRTLPQNSTVCATGPPDRLPFPIRARRSRRYWASDRPLGRVASDRLLERPGRERLASWRSSVRGPRLLLRKEVIQPHLPVRLPCYDFVPIADPTFDSSLPCGLGHWLRVLPTFVT